MTQLEIRPFQEEEIRKVHKSKRCGVVWHMGLGKTMCASSVGSRSRLRRWLVIAPRNAFAVWRDKSIPWIRLAWPESNPHIHILDGPKEEREALWNLQIDPQSPLQVHLFVCTVDTFLNDWSRRIKVKVPGRAKPQTVLELRPRPNYSFPQILVYDEFRRMRNRKSQAFKIIQKFMTYYPVEYFVPMSGTPGNQPQHFFTALNIIAPKVFPSFWKFVATFHYVFDTPFGKEIGQIRNEENWHRTLNRYFSVIKETDPGIANQLPSLQRLPLEIPLDPDQDRAYRDLEQDMLHTTANDDTIVASTTLALVTRLRQVLICPRILSPSLGCGSAIKDFCDTVEPEDGQHYVIFTPFTAAMEHFETYLRKEGHEHVYRLHGGLSIKEHDSILSSYQQSPRGGTMLCSLLYAQAFSLEPATKAFFIGYDWDPDNNSQAEARLRRLTSDVQVPITAYYYHYPDYDAAQNMYEIVVLKQERLNITIPNDLRNLFKARPKSDQNITVD